VEQDGQAAGSAADQLALAALVRAHRARLRLTQEKLAERAGLSERTLRNLEPGRSSRPYPNTIRRLADALELTGRHRDQFEAAARGVTPGLGSEGPAPCQLPPDVNDFTGRSSEVSLLTDLLTPATEGEAIRAVVVSAVAGKPGVGKTALAVHVAHRLRERFADGQLYINLRGAERQPMAANAVLGRFLRALGIEDGDVPRDQDEREALYRARLADRRVLVVPTRIAVNAWNSDSPRMIVSAPITTEM
jgi:transcriptional regulator with XRE-family HTH domain